MYLRALAKFATKDGIDCISLSVRVRHLTAKLFTSANFFMFLLA